VVVRGKLVKESFKSKGNQHGKRERNFAQKGDQTSATKMTTPVKSMERRVKKWGLLRLSGEGARFQKQKKEKLRTNFTASSKWSQQGRYNTKKEKRKTKLERSVEGRRGRTPGENYR